MEAVETFGTWLRRRRRQLDLTQEALAERVGCSAIMIRKLEAGLRNPSRQVAELLADCLQPPDRAAFVALARGCASSLLLAEAPAFSFPVKAHVPVPLTRLIGRNRELANVCTLLQSKTARLLTLVGAPGVGKTHLALHVANAVAPHFADGVTFVELAGVIKYSDALPTTLCALGLPAHLSPVDALRDRHLLLVLNTFEHVAEAASDIAALLQRCPRVVVLATSRRALGVGGERLHDVAPLSYAPPQLLALNLGRSAHTTREIYTPVAPAVELFVESLRAVQPDFLLDSENVSLVEAICTRLNGVPLLLELAARRAGMFSLTTLRDELDHDSALHVLNDGLRDSAPHQRELRHTLDWSVKLLEPEARRLFAWLSVFHESFTTGAVAAVAGEEGCGKWDALSLFAAVLEHHLVLRTNSTGDVPRFQMLQIVREYALEHLVETGQIATAEAHHATYFGELAAELGRAKGGAREYTLETLRLSIGDVRAMLEWNAEHDPVAALRAAADLREFWQATGLLREGALWLERLLHERARSACPLAIQAAALATASFLAFQQGDAASAEMFANQSLVIARRTEDWARVADATLLLGRAALQQARYDRANALSKESLRMFRAQSDPTGCAEALRSLAVIAKDRGDLARAALLCDESLALFQRIGDTRGIARVRFNQSTVAYWRGDYAASARLAGEAAGFFEHLGDAMGLGYARETLGMVAYQQCDYAEAERCLASSLSLMREVEDLSGVALVLQELGQLAQAQHDLLGASRLFSECLELATRIGDRRRAMFCMQSLAAVLAAHQPQIAARMLGGVAALRETLGLSVLPSERAEVERDVAAVRRDAGVAAFEAAWNEGHSAPSEQFAQALARDATERLVA